MLKNKKNKPLYMKKSKAAKQRELEVDEYEKNDYFVESTTSIRNSPRKGEKYRRPKSKGRAQQREYYDDDDSYETQYENSKMYEMEEDMSEYYTVDERRRYRHRQPEVKYYQSEFECSNSNCSEGCEVCEKNRKRRAPEMWDFEYAGHRKQGQSRGAGDWNNVNRHDRRRRYSDFDDRMPYVNNSKYIYLASQPSDHRAFTDALEVEQTSTATENDSELYYQNRNDQASNEIGNKLNGDESESDAEHSSPYEEKAEGSKDFGGYQKFPLGKKESGHQYQVYSTQVDDKAGTAFKQHIGIYKEEDISLLVGFKNSESSTMVHLPVVYSKIQKQGKRIMYPKELKKVFEERPVGKSVETDMLVYAATNYEQENVFKKEQDKVEAANFTKSLQNISLYHVTDEKNPLQQKQSGTQLIKGTKSPNASSDSVNKFPVDNSYIRVTSVNKSRSTHSLIGSTGKGRIRGSGFFSKAYKKDKKVQELKKKKSKDKIAKNSDSPNTGPEYITSVINPIKHEDEYQERQDEKRLTKGKSKEKNVNEKMDFDEVGKNMKQTNALGEKENNAIDQSKKTKLKQIDNSYINSEDTRKGVQDKKTAASVWNINPSKRESGKGLIKKVSKSRQSSEANKIRLSKDQDIETPRVEQEKQVPKSKSLELFVDSLENKEDDILRHSTSLMNVKSLETAVRKNKKARNIFRRKKRTSSVDDTKNSQSSLHAKEHGLHGLVKRIPSKERSIQWSETRIVKQKDTLLVKLFKATVIFLGIDMHGSMIKIFNCFEE